MNDYLVIAAIVALIVAAFWPKSFFSFTALRSWFSFPTTTVQAAKGSDIDPIAHLLLAQESFVRNGDFSKAAKVAAILTEGPSA